MAIVTLIISAAAFIAIYFAPVEFSPDGTADKLWRDTLTRAVLSAAVLALAALCGYGGYFKVKKGILKDAAWCLPCLAVALANFPYTALIGGSAHIYRADLIWLFALKCLFIAVSEEILFRGIALDFAKEMTRGKRHAYIVCVTCYSAVFAVFHLFNLIEGAGIAPTLLQVGYTFLTGMMFASVAMRTGNLWGGIILHFIFDIGGLIIGDLGGGAFQDVWFWALTAIAGVVCAVHLIIYAVRRDREESLAADAQSDETTDKDAQSDETTDAD